jgi:uncharacterized membrane protein
MGVVIKKNILMTSLLGDATCQYKQSTEKYALFKNKVDLFKDFSQKLILTVLSNLFRTLRTHCILYAPL